MPKRNANSRFDRSSLSLSLSLYSCRSHCHCHCPVFSLSTFSLFFDRVCLACLFIYVFLALYPSIRVHLFFSNYQEWQYRSGSARKERESFHREAAASDHNITHNNNNNNSHNLHAHSDALLYLPPPPTSSATHPHHHRYSAATPAAGSFSHHQLNQILHDQQQETNPTSTTGYYFMDTNTNGDSSSVKARIMAHPHYPRLLDAYLNCQKVGAPAEVVARLEEACTAVAMGSAGCIGSIGEDPALDQFMEAYCEMLSKYEQELTKPFKEAMLFLSRIESQFKAITLSSSSSSPIADHSAADRNNGSSEDEVDANNYIDPSADDGDLKVQLLRKYSGYLGSLKQEFMKKRKKGKLPKEARQQLMEWWSRHYKWPYPSESQKLALAESTGLDQKQINNWFINQRKRHWKPSEDMQFVVMDAAHQHAHVHHPHHHYLDAVLGNPSFPMDISPSLL